MMGRRLLAQIFELQNPLHARLLPMEGLRGIAVILVFLQHYSVQAQLIGLSPGLTLSVARAFQIYGNQGVELFFVLSGYLIYGTLVRRASPFFGFMARRIQRIYPTFLVVFALMMAMVIFIPIPDKLPTNLPAAVLYVVANLLLLPGLFPIIAIHSVTWSLSYEMFFYISIGILVTSLGMNKMRRSLRITIIGVLTVDFVCASFVDIACFPVRMMPFFAGMLLAEGLGDRVTPWMIWTVPMAALVILSRAASIPTAELFQSIAFFILCAVCFREVGRISAWMICTPLRWLGNMSYSYYLLHGIVVRVIMVSLTKIFPLGMSDRLFWTLMPTIFLLTLLASALLFIFIEKPISLHSKGFGKRLSEVSHHTS